MEVKKELSKEQRKYLEAVNDSYNIPNDWIVEILDKGWYGSSMGDFINRNSTALAYGTRYYNAK